MSYKHCYIPIILLVLGTAIHCLSQTPEEVYKQTSVLSRKKDSIRTAEKKAAVTLIETKYRTAEKDKQLIRQQILLNRQKNEIRRKDLFLIIGSGFLLLAISFLLVVYFNYKNKSKLDKKYLQKRRQQIEIDNLNTMMLAEEKERLQLAKAIQYGIATKLKLLNTRIIQLSGRYAWLAQNTAFKEVMQQMNATELELKQTSQNLAPDIILHNGIYKAVTSFCSSLHQSTGLTITCSQNNEIPEIDAEVEISLYRIIQELIQNIIKHAAASLVSVLFDYDDGLLIIVINDNGTGFTNESQKRQDGMGLKNIDVRVKALGGSIIIADNLDGGATTRVKLPLPAAT